jgi:carboxyl-terminal processing protease
MMRGSLIPLGTAAGIALSLITTQPQLLLNSAGAKAGTAGNHHQLRLFRDVFERVRANYVEKADDAKLIESAISGMLAGLDPHSSYMDERSFRNMQLRTRGEFGDLGIEVTIERGVIRVMAAPMDGTPAARAGIMANDIITHLDEKPLQNLMRDQVVEKMRGPVNTKVKLTIMRDGQNKPFDVSITRQLLRMHAVRSRMEGDDVGFIHIPEFNQQAADGLKTAVADLTVQSSNEIKGFIVDLRNNPGGLLEQAVSVSDAFLEKGEIVSIRGRIATEIQHFHAHAGDLANGKPLIVLINGDSASAAEIVAVALQDHRRATVIGTRSFGKGSVQSIIPLGSGNGALLLTIARYYTPSGRSIQAKGVSPDIEVFQDVPEEIKTRTDTRGESSLRGHLKAEGTEETGSQSYIPPNPKDDKALHTALDLIRGLAKNPAYPPNPKLAVKGSSRSSR